MRTLSLTTASLGKSAVLGALAVVLVAAGAYAADPPAAPPQQQEQHQRGAWLQKKLGLTDVQAQQIREIQAKDFASQKPNWQALRQAQGELRRLALSGADSRTLSAKQTEVQNLLNQSVQARVNTLAQIGPILSPEQREAYAKMMDHGPRHHRQMKRNAPAQQPS
jgi:Spy/CpxP family protein refolding chaperone